MTAVHDPTPSGEAQVLGRVTHLATRPEEGWINADGSELVWRTLLSADRDGSVSMCAGMAEIPVSPIALPLHRHAQDEIYFVVSGHGDVEIDGVTNEIGPGSCVFVPGNAWHAIRNPGPDSLRLFYCFPTPSFTDVVYEYAPDAPAPKWLETPA
jgi:mannose-6-phosphate isomerase-like protein (cupin superfamily)